MDTLTSNGSRFNLLPMHAFSREMNRWIDELTASDKCSGHAPVSIWESESHFHFEFDLPGVSVDNVDLNVVEKVLHVTASRAPKDGVEFVRQERKFGTVERKFNLPDRVDAEGIEAEMNSGVLTLNIPKAPEAQVKKIQIKEN